MKRIAPSLAVLLLLTRADTAAGATGAAPAATPQQRAVLVTGASTGIDRTTTRVPASATQALINVSAVAVVRRLVSHRMVSLRAHGAVRAFPLNARRAANA